MIDWKKRIPAEEKYEALTNLTPYWLVLVSGILSAVSLVIGFMIIHWAIIFIIGSDIKVSIVKSLSSYTIAIVISTFMGIVMTEFERFYYRHRVRPFKVWYTWPWVYVFLSACLLIIITIILALVMKNDIQRKALLDFFEFDNLSALAWTAFIVGVLVISFTFANPLEFLWRTVYRWLIQNLSPIDYISIIEENRFLNELRFRFDEARRYQIPLSLMIMRVNNYQELLNKLGVRLMHKIQRKASELVAEQLRHTDVIGILKDGQMRMILTYTPLKNTALIGERVREIIDHEDIVIRSGEKIRMQVIFGVACYTPEMQEPEELLTKATSVVGQEGQTKDIKKD